ncbi:MAG: hypothetical protein GWN62_26930, partial [Aliifodinibius sp.]|nr:hypothetical protein [Fodinibius sp.]
MNFNGKRSYIILLVILLIISVSSIFAQSPNDSVDATFFYKPDGNPSNVYLPGEFNGWVINNPQTRMTLNPSTGVWSKTVRLRVGGPDPLPAPTSIPGAYQYKFHADGTWLSDPLNPRQNPDDFNNSYLFINDPTIHYLLPNSTQAVGILRTRFPQISAYIFPAIGSQVDTSSIMLQIDSLQFTNIGDRYDTTTHKLSFTPPVPLGDGRHDLLLSVASDTGQPTIDTTSFTVQADVV